MVAACGSADAPAPTRTRQLAVAQLAPPAGPDDVVVARVAGQPVWGSCVAAQARGRHVDVKAALDDCIALEVAAHEAARRGLDRDPDVIERTEQAMVSRLIDRDFAARYRTAQDLPAAFVDPIMKRNEWRLGHDEYRGSFFARVDAPEQTAPPGSPADVAAEQIARAAYATLAGRKDLFPGDVERAVRAAAGPAVAVTAKPFPPTTGDNVKPYYRATLFGLAAVGEVSAPVRSPWGWDLVLWTSVLPALTQTRDDILGQLFEPMRQAYFIEWAGAAGSGHQIELIADRATAERLLGGGEPAPMGPPGAPPRPRP